LIASVSAEPLPDGDDRRYQLLGGVGYFMGACRRHEICDTLANPSGLTAASRLAGLLGSTLGVGAGLDKAT
jgi:hypothetical protein